MYCYKSNPRLKIEDVYVGIAGNHIKSLQTRGDIVRHDNENEITQKEIEVDIVVLSPYFNSDLPISRKPKRQFHFKNGIKKTRMKHSTVVFSFSLLSTRSGNRTRTIAMITGF
jgi:hypothetical protein